MTDSTARPLRLYVFSTPHGPVRVYAPSRRVALWMIEKASAL